MRIDLGSAEVFYALKAAHDAGDDDYMMALIWEPLKSLGLAISYKKSGFRAFSYDEREDAVQHAGIQVWRSLDAFLNNPDNDPWTGIRSEGERKGWFSTVIERNLSAWLEKEQRRRERLPVAYSLDAGIDDSGDDNRTNQDMTHVDAPAPDMTAAAEHAFVRALQVFYGLKRHQPDTLTAVGYRFIDVALRKRPWKLEDYVSYFMQNKVSDVFCETTEILQENYIDSSVTDPLRLRLEKPPRIIHFRQLTAEQLSNRTSAIMDKVRDIIKRDGQ